MFAKAYSLASRFTHPLVVCLRYYDGTIESGLGAFVVLNADGWLLTAAHNFGAYFSFARHQQELRAYQEQAASGSHSSAMVVNPKWITDFAIMLAGQPIAVEHHYIYREHDLALLKVDSRIFAAQTQFPRIINPASIRPGTSLCKFGFPFVQVNAGFNPQNRSFTLPGNLLPVPFFPIEGIYTRNLSMGRTPDQAEILYLETSSPGLKGQSGGPICDTEGNIYAIQSQNVTMPLGFKGIIRINDQPVEENQFLNVGIGVHPSTIVALLQKHGVPFGQAEPLQF